MSSSPWGRRRHFSYAVPLTFELVLNQPWVSLNGFCLGREGICVPDHKWSPGQTLAFRVATGPMDLPRGQLPDSRMPI